MNTTMIRFFLIAACALLIPTLARAADGTLGTTSTGTSTVSVTVPNLVLITDVGNLALGTWSGSGDEEGDDDVCIYTNKAAATYFVTASGSGAASAFTLASGGNTLAYEVYFNDQSGTTGETQLTTTVKSGAQTGADTTDQDCNGGGLNANFHVVIPEANLLAAPSGAYSGTLTLLIEPT